MVRRLRRRVRRRVTPRRRMPGQAISRRASRPAVVEWRRLGRADRNRVVARRRIRRFLSGLGSLRLAAVRRLRRRVGGRVAPRHRMRRLTPGLRAARPARLGCAGRKRVARRRIRRFLSGPRSLRLAVVRRPRRRVGRRVALRRSTRRQVLGARASRGAAVKPLRRESARRRPMGPRRRTRRFLSGPGSQGPAMVRRLRLGAEKCVAPMWRTRRQAPRHRTAGRAGIRQPMSRSVSRGPGGQRGPTVRRRRPGLPRLRRAGAGRRTSAQQACR
jgi:hypothetical protein